MLLALKVDVDTLRGVRTGVPKLVELFERHAAGATFFFSVGPDHSARAIASGALWPGPQLARRGGAIMRGVRDAGFETAVQAYDAARWQRHASRGSVAWTEAEMQRALDRYADVFGEAPRAHGAAGWQTNAHALRISQRLGFDYCSDGRGDAPYLPVRNAELVRCPQLPTTLPTLDELLTEPGITQENVAAHLLERSLDARPPGHVFGLRAESDGIALAPVVDRLLTGWRAQGYTLAPLRALYDAVEPLALPRCEVEMASVPGRRGTVLKQGPEFLGAVEIDLPTAVPLS